MDKNLSYLVEHKNTYDCYIDIFHLLHFQSYRSKSKLFSPSNVSASDDLQCPNTGSSQNMLSQSLSVGGLQSNTPSLAALHSNRYCIRSKNL